MEKKTLKERENLKTSPFSPLQSSTVTGRGWPLLACSIYRVRLPIRSWQFCESERMLCTKATKLPGQKSGGGRPERGEEEGVIKDTHTTCTKERGLELLSI